MNTEITSIPLKEAWYIDGQNATMVKGMTFSMSMAGYTSSCIEHYFIEGGVSRKVDEKALAYDEQSAIKLYDEKVQYWVNIYEKWAKDNTEKADKLKAKLKK